MGTVVVVEKSMGLDKPVSSNIFEQCLAEFDGFLKRFRGFRFLYT